MADAENTPRREYPTSENVIHFPTHRGWKPAVVPVPRRRKLAEPDPFFALEKEHLKLYRKKRPLEQENWALRHLPEDSPRRRKITASLADLERKIDKLEDAMIAGGATANPAVLIAQINIFRDWVDFRREAMVDVVIAALRDLLSDRRVD